MFNVNWNGSKYFLWERIRNYIYIIYNNIYNNIYIIYNNIYGTVRSPL